jgi:hypothetical protein
MSIARGIKSFVEIFMENPPTRKRSSDARTDGRASNGVHSTRHFGGRRIFSNGAVKLSTCGRGAATDWGSVSRMDEREIDNAGTCVIRHAPESQNLQWVDAGLVWESAAGTWSVPALLS